MNKKTVKITQNLSYAFLAQTLSLGINILISFVLPKFIGITAYSYWQLFIFYTTYAGFFHLGLTDGIYLRIGGKSFRDLNHALLGSEMKFLNVFQSGVALLIILIVPRFGVERERLFVIVCFLLYMVIFNSVAYLGYIFQAVNRTKDYSTAIIIEKTFCLLAMVTFILLRVKDFRIYISSYIVCDGFALAYCIWKGREMVFSKWIPLRVIWKELICNIRIGAKLLVANLASLLIIGANRLLIDKHWGIETFGKFSMAISLTNFFLLFIMQISMVLFPILKQSEENHLKKFYTTMREVLFLILPIIFVTYFPMQIFLGIWLPQYVESFRYLILLLPICIYDGRMQLLCSTYFKVLRKEQVLLAVNLIAMLVSGALGIIGAYVFDNVYFIIFAIVFAVVLRAVISEIYLGKVMNIAVAKSLVLEGVLVVYFMTLAWVLPSGYAFLLYGFGYLLYVFVKREDVKQFQYLIHKKYR